MTSFDVVLKWCSLYNKWPQVRRETHYIPHLVVFTIHSECMINSIGSLSYVNNIGPGEKLHAVWCNKTVNSTIIIVRDWSLITGRGGLQNGRGQGHVKFYPYEKGGGGGEEKVLPLRKGGAEKVLAMLNGGHKKFWGSFSAVA